MAVELDHSFSTTKPIDESYAAVLDLERVIPCVEGGRVIERTRTLYVICSECIDTASRLPHFTQT